MGLNRNDYSIDDDGILITKASLFLRKSCGIPKGGICHGSLFDYAEPNFNKWAESYDFKPVPNDMWEEYNRRFNQSIANYKNKLNYEPNTEKIPNR